MTGSVPVSKAAKRKEEEQNQLNSTPISIIENRFYGEILSQQRKKS